MTIHEATATVEAPGQIRVAGLPYAAGTDVDVTIVPVTKDAHDPRRVQRLLAALDAARNTSPLSRLRRAELYDRDILR